MSNIFVNNVYFLYNIRKIKRNYYKIKKAKENANIKMKMVIIFIDERIPLW